MTLEDFKSGMEADQEAHLFGLEMDEEKFDFFNDKESESPLSPILSDQGESPLGANLN